MSYEDDLAQLQRLIQLRRLNSLDSPNEQPTETDVWHIHVQYAPRMKDFCSSYME